MSKAKKIFTYSSIDKEESFKSIDVKSFPEEIKRSKLVSNSSKVATASNETEGGRQIANQQSRSITVYRKIKLIHSPSDPLTASTKQRIERAIRTNFCVRIAMHLREYSAYRNQKLIIELIPSDKVILSQEEQTAKIKQLTNDHKDLLREIETRDNNVGLPEKLKTLAWQCWSYGRNALLILYESGDSEKINTLFQINSRRLGEPILNEEEDLKFEGCIVDGSGLDKNSMIYAVYQDRELSPHTVCYGYSIAELILLEAEAHNYMIQNTKEVALSAFLPTILLKVDTEAMSSSDKNTKVSNLIAEVAPGKIIGVPNDVEDAEMLDMKPDYAGYVTMMDSLEIKIYNAFHVPLFLVKSDEIANRATANKSAKLFLDGVVTDDQKWMQETLGSQWYDPLLREELKKSNKIEKTVDTSDPDDTEAPLPFLIRRKFVLPTVEDFLDLADALVTLKTNNIWDTAKTNEILETPEITNRVVAEEKDKKKLENDKLIAEVETMKNKGNNVKQVAVASKSFNKKKEELLEEMAKKVREI